MLDFFIAWLQEAKTSPSSLFALLSALFVVPTFLSIMTYRSVRALAASRERSKANFDRAESMLKKVAQLEAERAEHARFCSTSFVKNLEAELGASNFGRAVKLCEDYLDRERENILKASEYVARDALVYLFEDQEIAASRALENVTVWAALDTRDHVLRLKDSVEAATNRTNKRLNVRGEQALKEWSLRAPNHAMSLFEKSRIASEQGQHRIALALMETALPLFSSKYGMHAEQTVMARAVFGSEMCSCGRIADGESFLREAVHDARTKTGADNPATLKIVETWAEALVFCNQVEAALAIHRDNLDRIRAVCGWDSIDALLTEAKIARCLIKENAYESAEELLLELLPRMRKCRDIKFDTILKTDRLLADVFLGQKKVDEAIRLYSDELVWRKEHFGDEHPDTLIVEHRLGRAHMENGSLETAEKIFRRLWPVEKKVKGPEHHDPIATLAALGQCLLRQEKWNEAEKTFRQVLPLTTVLYGKDGAEVIATKHEMAKAIKMQERSVEAEGIFRDLVTIILDGQTDTKLLSHVRHELALALFEQERYVEAEAEFRAKLELQDKDPDVVPEDRLSAQHGICRCILEQGRTKESIILFEDLIDHMTREIGPANELLLRCTSDLALAYSRSDQSHKAAEILQKVLDRESEVLGRADKSALVTRSNLLATWIDLGRADEAERAMREHLLVVEDLLGSERKETVALRHNIASAILEQGRAAEAAATFIELVPVTERVFGADHRNVLYARWMSASAVLEDERPAEAEWKMKSLLPTFSTLLGRDHENTLALQTTYIRSILEQGRIGDAVELAEDHLAHLRSLNETKTSNLETAAILLARIQLEMGNVELAQKTMELVSGKNSAASNRKNAMAFIVRAWLADCLGDTALANEQISNAENWLSKVQDTVYPKRELALYKASRMSSNGATTLQNRAKHGDANEVRLVH